MSDAKEDELLRGSSKYAESAVSGKQTSERLWYDDSTSKSLAEEVLAIAQPDGKVACIGCPSVYQAVWRMKPTSVSVVLLDNVKQFEHYKENYVFYDYNQPLDLPQEMERAFDIVVVDPPFLSEECLCKTALTTRYIAKDKILLCTGSSLQDTAVRLLNVRTLKFRPKHTQSVMNEYRCYTNYTPMILNS